MSNSYAPEVQTDNSGNWYGNALRFATESEAQKQVRNLSLRWLAVQDTRVVQSDDPPNYLWDDNSGLAELAHAATVIGSGDDPGVHGNTTVSRA